MTDDQEKQQAENGARPPLTEQERDVLTVSARGQNVAEVARTLAMTEDGVRLTLMAARQKLGARSKLEAVIIALRRGDIDPEA